MRDAGHRPAANTAKHGLTCHRTLAQAHLRRDVIGQIDVDAAAEADEADALTGGDHVARLDETDDAARDQAGNLGKADLAAIAPLDHEMLALILVRRLVEIGIQELARDIDDLTDDARDRCAVDVHVEHRHEDRHADQRRLAQFADQFARDRHALDHGDQPIGGWGGPGGAPRRGGFAPPKTAPAPIRGLCFIPYLKGFFWGE